MIIEDPEEKRKILIEEAKRNYAENEDRIIPMEEMQP